MPCHYFFPYDDYNDDIDCDNVATIIMYLTMCQQLCHRFIEIILFYQSAYKSNINTIL